MLCVYSYVCLSRKLISDLMACVKLPKVTKSTWVVTLFRKKSGSWRYCPFLPSSVPHTQLSPQKILLAGTLSLWVQISASAALLACPHMHTRVEMTGHTHSTSRAMLRPWVRPQTTPATSLLASQPLGRLTTCTVPSLGPSKSFPKTPRSEQWGYRPSGSSQKGQITGPVGSSGAGKARTCLE